MPWFLYSDVKENEAEKKMLRPRKILFRDDAEMKWSREDEGGNVRNFRLSAVTPVNLSPSIPPRLIIYLSGKDFKFQTFPRRSHCYQRESSDSIWLPRATTPRKKGRKEMKSQEKFLKFFLPVQLRRFPSQSHDEKISFAPKLPPTTTATTTKTFSINFAVSFSRFSFTSTPPLWAREKEIKHAI